MEMLTLLKARLLICTSDIYIGDAIGNFSLQLAKFFNLNGFDVLLFSRYFNNNDTPDVMDLDLLPDLIREGDIIFAQYSIFEKSNYIYQNFDNKKIVYYHGITPPEYFRNIDTNTEENCSNGIAQASLFSGFDFYCANSVFMLNELFGLIQNSTTDVMNFSNSLVIPPVLNFSSRLLKFNNDFLDSNYSPYFLYVGRIAPHKKIEDLLDWFDEYVKLDNNICLKIVGVDVLKSYTDFLHSKIDDMNEIKNKVEFKGHLKDDQLSEIYQNAAGYITLSEHEGFCIPLLEAMGFQIPVFARNATAIPETLGRNSFLFNNQSFTKYAHEVFDVMSNQEMKNNLIRDQNKVYSELIECSSGSSLLSVINTLSKN
jgi:glycosyltransferase involved in cell wall biosynthesis